ncbi:MAG: tRNA (N6-threonylcarbamoyladenosine(37)-N6)-methyltransferase TrmO [Bacteroidetes bacterium]|nr:tRNA (N6-threonylcarbamoyladenosine(37)-N6)-methyltransferase TrmO [Bacteroidota bacterium]
MEIIFKPIGKIISPFRSIKEMPIQPAGAKGIQGKVIIFPEFAEGLKDLDGFSHIILLYYFHKVISSKLTVVPFLDSKPRGVFATRAPKRPNPIGLSVVKLLDRNNNILNIQNVDILDGTPLLDIKPYVPDFDHIKESQIGWLKNVIHGAGKKKSDDRFK